MLAGGTLGGVLRHPDPPLADERHHAAGEDPARRRHARGDLPGPGDLRAGRACRARTPARTRWPGSPSASSSSRRAGRSTGSRSTSTGEVVASVAIQGIADDRAEVGYWVAAPARGRGLAARAVRLVSPWALGELGLRQLEIIAHEDNAASLRGRPRRRLHRDGRDPRAAAGRAAGRALRRVHLAALEPSRAREALVEPVDEPGDDARVDDVGDLGLAVDDVGAGGLRAVARVAGRARSRSPGRRCRA